MVIVQGTKPRTNNLQQKGDDMQPCRNCTNNSDHPELTICVACMLMLMREELDEEFAYVPEQKRDEVFQMGEWEIRRMMERGQEPKWDFWHQFDLQYFESNECPEDYDPVDGNEDCDEYIPPDRLTWRDVEPNP